MGKHGSYDAAYLFFEQLTDPVGSFRLDPSRVKFRPDDYPNDAQLWYLVPPLVTMPTSKVS